METGVGTRMGVKLQSKPERKANSTCSGTHTLFRSHPLGQSVSLSLSLSLSLCPGLSLGLIPPLSLFSIEPGKKGRSWRLHCRVIEFRVVGFRVYP